VQSVTTIYNYYKKFGYKTEIMGASFRNIGELEELAGCDLLTISPKLLAELEATERELTRKLDPTKVTTMEIEKLSIDQTTFEQMHKADAIASEKLDEGIKGFTKALEVLEELLAKRLVQLESGAKVGVASDEIFQSYDLDGDGFITREDWLGSAAVFDALDEDCDGKISPDEMRSGLGGLFQLASTEG
jgi:transaldolase